MSQLALRELTIKDEQAFLSGYEDWKNEDLSWYSFIWKPGMRFQDHLLQLEDQKDENKIASNRVASSMLYAFVDGKIVGRLSVRHDLNEDLKQRGGHLGYAVSPKHRQKGYATEIFRQGLKYCKDLGLQSVLVTCSDNNVGSWKIIEKFAAHLENRIDDKTNNEVVRRYWVDIQNSLSGDFQVYQKVLAYITRQIGQETELLVFDHDAQFSDAGTQVPSGSVEISEDLKAALLREVFEESGLNQSFKIKKIDEYLFFADWSKKYLKRHIFHLQTNELLPNKWTHTVSGHGEDAEMNFHFYWLNLKDVSGSLSARMDDSIFNIKNKFKIFEAKLEDAEEIAKINVDSWKTTYLGIVSQDFLNQLNYENRMTGIQKSLQRPEIKIFLAKEVKSNKVVGFSMFGPCREKNIDADFELYAIYLYKEFQGLGAGKLLFDKGFEVFKQLNYNKMIVSVLSENKPSCRFYEKMGGQIAKPDHVDLGDKRYPTVTYVWKKNE